MKATYITAVLEELQAGAAPDMVLTGLGATLQKRGHDRLYSSILKGVVRVLEAQSAEVVTVTVANEQSYKTNQVAIASILQQLKADAEPAVVVDPTIIGGYSVEANAKRVDHTYKTKLVNLYRSLTNN